jgi:hypothetical protein
MVVSDENKEEVKTEEPAAVEAEPVTEAAAETTESVAETETTESIAVTETETTESKAETAEAESKAESAEAEPKAAGGPITVTTPINLDTRAALSRRILLGYWLPFAALTAVFALIGVLLWVLLDPADSGIGISIFVIGLVIPPAIYGGALLLAKFNLRRTPGARTEKSVVLTFADQITGTEIADDATRPVEYDYSIIRKIYETKAYFFLIVNSGAAIAVAKSGFTAGTPDELRELLRHKTNRA